ncbi:MAG: hypothetical protein V4450_00405 [Bacteroidota bacterium]
MKKIILLGFSFVLLLQIHAQTKVTKANVVGKWNISAVEMTGLFYYSIEKDSLAIGDMMKSQIQDPSQLATITSTMKMQMAMFSTMAFIFNADGTAKLGVGTGQEQDVTYTVDETESTITTVDKDKKEDTLKAEMVNENLRLVLKQPQGEIIMIVKKVKA